MASRAAPFSATVAAGLLFAAACPPREWAPLAWLVPGILLVATRRLSPLRAVLAGMLFGLVFGATMSGWAFHASLAYFDFDRLASGAFVTAVWLVYGGIPFGALVAGYGIAARRLPAATRPAVGAWLWVASEALRATLFTGMPWELLGHTQFRALTLVQIADAGGVYAVSLVVAFVSLTAAEFAAELRTVTGWRTVVLRRLAPAAGLVAAVLLYGVEQRAVWAAPTGDTRTVAVVQGNVPNAFRWKRAFFERTLATYAGLTSRVAAAAPDLVVWPENAVNFYIDREPLLHAELARSAAVAREGLLVGGPRLTDDGSAHNSAYLLGANGAIQATYDKQRLVPLAEYVPFRSLTRAPALEPAAYVAGKPADPLHARTLRLGTVICYEALFPHLVRGLVRRGADVLVNLSNDSWLDDGDGGAPRQHFSMVVFRAIETRRYLVRASASGVSGFVRPDGAPFSLVARDTAGTAVGRIVALHGTTPYVRWGDTWVVVGGLFAAGLVAAGRRGAAA